MTENLDKALLLGSLVLLVAVAAVRLSTRAGLPSLLIYLAIGVALGESGLGIDFENVDLTRVLGICALVVIIAEGGLSTRWSVVRPVLPAAATLATFGVVASVVVVGVVVHLLLDVSLQMALLYGAVLSSTDAAAVFATLRRLLLRPRLSATLEAESGINDAPAVLLVLALSVPADPHLVWWQELLSMLYELGAGGLVGVGVGVLGAYGLRRAALPAVGLYPLAAAGLTILAYALGASLHASGFLAVYTCGLILGNARIPHRQAVLGFADGLAWLAQIGLFVLLGLLASPGRLPSAVVPALVVGTVLVVAARPLSVLLSVIWFRVGWREQVFLSWAGLRGAVPIVLATIPLSAGVPGATRLFDVVFVLVVIFTLLQATSLAPVARWLGVTAPAEATELRVETAPLDEMNAEMLQLTVPQGSHLSGMYIDELRLPQGAAVTLVLREGQGFVPQPTSRLRSGDSLLIVATTDSRDAAERRLRAVSRRGRLARWYGEKGEVEPH